MTNTGGAFLVSPSIDACDHEDGRPTVYVVLATDGTPLGTVAMGADASAWYPTAYGREGDDHGPLSSFDAAVAWILMRHVVVLDAPAEPAMGAAE
ncbi:hypothetical protein HDA32_000127 [Spinactinospora alkalitolerans]|uniref:Uncharacterized protein n=1 Tax=Spinactinospora alkalitolerans TaxID=687207 RepID=A0A852TNY9_9ACTN|nr:hypothetical protein [Spinactinospora alkalitolerans]NYE45007.1 hypothetical protein [Spinactinospora alkalitolerans]